MTYSQQHLEEAIQIVRQLDAGLIEKAVEQLRQIRDRGGRLFILGVGGSAANASHAVNDFRKICGFEAYAPTDNVSELTARTNDEGWASVFVEWLKGSRLSRHDGLLIFSVGGGNLEKNVSPNLVSALQLAKEVGAAVIAVRRGGAIHPFDTINHLFLICEMIIPGSCYWNFGIGREKGEVEKDEEGVRTMKVLGENMAWVLKKLA